MKSLQERKKQRLQTKVANAAESDQMGGDKEDGEGDGETNILDGNVASIAAALEGMGAQELIDLEAQENARPNPRVGVRDAITKARAKLAGGDAGWSANNG